MNPSGRLLSWSSNMKCIAEKAGNYLINVRNMADEQEFLVQIYSLICSYFKIYASLHVSAS